MKRQKYACIGAIIGDIVGSPYEFDRHKGETENFPLFSDESDITDDSIMTLAVAKAFAETMGKDQEIVRSALIANMADFGKTYPHAGYGARFAHWVHNPVPYGSYGNGSAMRVSSAGWLFNSLPEVMDMAKLSAEVSHNHPEGVKGAQATAAAIYLTRNGASKKELRKFIENAFAYDLSRSLDEIRPTYRHVESCQQTVPEAITAYLEGESFEDVLRKAVSLGGDADTLTAIAASIAEAKYEIPQWIADKTLDYLDDKLLNALEIYQSALENYQ